MTGLRPAEPGDLDRVVRMEREIFGPQAWSRATVREEFAAVATTRDIAVALDDEETVVGYSVVSTVGDVADLLRIAVSPRHRTRGIGSLLLHSACSRARAAGLGRMLLEVQADNTDALALYRRHGFAEIDRRAGYYPGGVDALVLELTWPLVS